MMIRRLAFIIGLLFTPALANAACQVQIPNGAVQNCVLPTMETGWMITPVSGGSQAINAGATLGSNSPGFPLGTPLPLPAQGFIVYVELSSGGPAYVCKLGGTCSSANGIEVLPTSEKTFVIGVSTVMPTVACPSGCALEVRW